MKIQFLKKALLIQKVIKFNIDSFQVAERKKRSYEIESIKVGKIKGCSDIYLGSDRAYDESFYYLINVPNGLFKQINE